MKRYGGIKGKLDKLVGDWFRSRSCEVCGEGGRVEWCHIKSRRYLSVRWSRNNGFSGCAACHRFFTDNPDCFMKWLKSKKKKQYAKLIKEFMPINPMKEWQLKELYERLKVEIETWA